MAPSWAEVFPWGSAAGAAPPPTGAVTVWLQAESNALAAGTARLSPERRRKSRREREVLVELRIDWIKRVSEIDIAEAPSANRASFCSVNHKPGASVACAPAGVREETATNSCEFAIIALLALVLPG